MSEAEFWASTPYLTKLAVEAHVSRQQHVHALSLFTAWHVAALSRQKRLPDLKKLLSRAELGGRRRRQSPEEIRMVFEALAAATTARNRRKQGSPPHG